MTFTDPALFYPQLMCSGRPDMLESLQLSNNPKDYFWVSQGVTKVDGMDDKEEFDLTDVRLVLVSFRRFYQLNNWQNLTLSNRKPLPFLDLIPRMRWVPSVSLLACATLVR